MGCLLLLDTTGSCVLVQTGSGQSLVTRALVISLLNRIKVCWAPTTTSTERYHNFSISLPLCDTAYVSLQVNDFEQCCILNA